MRTTFLAMLCFVLLSSAARADQKGSLDVSSSLSTFSSPNTSYGPWLIDDVNLRLPPGGDVGFEFSSRSARDSFNPNTQHYGAIDDYYHWSKDFTSYALFGVGSGPPYASTRGYVEGDLSLSRRFVAELGAGDAATTGLGATRSIHLGSTYYKGDAFISFAYTPAWSQLIGYTQSYLLTVAFGHPGRTTETIYLGTGSESDVSLQNITNPSIVGERETGATLTIRHWVTSHAGYHVGYEYGVLTRGGGGIIYRRNTIDLGLFTAIGR